MGQLRRWLCLVALPLLWACAVAAQANLPCPNCADWNRPQAPFRIFGNTYYVGPYGLSSILIASESGNVLIDGALPESAAQIAANIKSLGFRIEDVKLILNSHVHFDHAGGIAELQRLSGATVIASHWSAKVLKRGGVARDDPQYGILAGIPAAKHVRELRDGETFRVGDLAITAHLTPGHTPGGTSWTWRSCEDSVCRNLVYADSLSPVSAPGFKFGNSRNDPHAQPGFEKSFSFLEAVPCDVLVTPHPEASGLWDHLAARERGAKPDPMVDKSACQALAKDMREQLEIRLAAERKK